MGRMFEWKGNWKRSIVVRAWLAISLMACIVVPHSMAQQSTVGEQACPRLAELLEIDLAAATDDECVAIAEEFDAIVDFLLADQRSRGDFACLWNVFELTCRLVDRGGPAIPGVLEEIDLQGLRDIAAASGNPQWGAQGDYYLVQSLLYEGYWAAADLVIDSGLATYIEDPTSLIMMLSMRVSARSQEGNLDEALDVLQEIDLLIEDSSGDPRGVLFFEARVRAKTARSKVEMQLGRADHSWQALMSARDWVQEYAQESPAWGPRAEAMGVVVTTQIIDHLLWTERFEEVVRESRALIQGSHLEPFQRATCLLLEGAAWANLEAAKPVMESQARPVLLEALATGNLGQAEQLYAHASLIRLDLIAWEAGYQQEGLWDRVDHHIAAAKAIARPESSTSLRELPLRLRSRITGFEFRADLVRGVERAALEKHVRSLEALVADSLLEWKSSSQVVGGVGFLSIGDRRELLEDWIDLLSETGRPEEALKALFEVEAIGNIAQSIGSSSTSLAEVQDLLVGEGGVLLYFPAFFSTHLFAIDREGVTHLRLGNDFFLSSLVEELNFESKNTQAELARLSAELLPEQIHSRIASWSHLYVIGTGGFHNPPFELLPFGSSSLGREVAISYLPSLIVGVQLAKRARAASPPEAGSLSLFAAPPTSPSVQERWPGLTNLDDLELEWNRLSSGFPIDSVQSFVGKKATRQALLELLNATAEIGSGSNVLNLFCHGVFDRDALDFPAALAMGPSNGDDGLVWASDFAEQGVRADLVVLAVCGSARGPQRHGEDGVEHLGGVFLAAGANAVVQSRGDLEVASTLKACELLNERLLSGLSLAEALRQVRNQLATDDVASARSAPLFAFGLAHRPLFIVASPEANPPVEVAIEPADEEEEAQGSIGAWLISSAAFSMLLLAGVLVWRNRARDRRAA